MVRAYLVVSGKLGGMRGKLGKLWASWGQGTCYWAAGRAHFRLFEELVVRSHLMLSRKLWEKLHQHTALFATMNCVMPPHTHTLTPSPMTPLHPA